MARIRTIVVAQLFFIAACQATADELNVPAEYPTIQAAIDAAVNGDEIVLAPGNYVITQPLDTNSTSAATDFVLRSSNPNDPAVVEATVIDAQTPALFALSVGSLQLNGITLVGFECDRLVEVQIDSGLTIVKSVVNGNGDSGFGQFAADIEQGELRLEDSRFIGRIGTIASDNLSRVSIRNLEVESVRQSSTIQVATEHATIADSTFDGSATSFAFGEWFVGARNAELSNVTMIDMGMFLRAEERVTILGCRFEDVQNFSGDGSLFDTPIIEAFDSEFVYTDVVGQVDAVRAILEGNDVLVERCRFVGANELSFDEGFATLAPIVAGQSRSIPLSGVARAVVRDSEFVRSGGRADAAIVAFGQAIVERCHFEENSGPSIIAILAPSSQVDLGDSLIRDCTFINNGEGAILRTIRNGFPPTDTIFVDRAFIAGHTGYLYEGARFRDPPATVFSNSVYIGTPDNNFEMLGFGSASLENCTFVIGPELRQVPFWDNLTFGGSNAIRNCIVQYNAPEVVVGDVIIENSIFDSVPAGATDSTDLQPLFVRTPTDGGDGWGDDLATGDIDESANDDFGDVRLLPGSPAIDAGTNDFYTPGDVDLDGNPRLADDPGIPGANVDIGAYEFQGVTCLPDVDVDGSVDPADFEAWVAAYTDGSPLADQNRDGAVTPSDFNAWILNYNNAIANGCP